ncbi:hypothetical protein Clacol_008374 [Clathrus columnatus]|uniref:Elongation factor methyltransferase 7 n=1 Tax=Clathrus columnatus TaxID=1419009 RepID=A0AAV5AHJ6_9AGAM|nr:hypothetical protein Clacol_008374 [Clathrus columnatus]
MSDYDADENSLGGKSPPTPPLPEPTFATFRRPFIQKKLNDDTDNVEKRMLSIRLVGTHPLWGHHLWNAARSFAVFLEQNSERLCHQKNVLELGAGGGLPGIITALCGAKKIVLTDYPDQDLLDNLRINVKENVPPQLLGRVNVQGYIWGRDVSDLVSSQDKFDLILMSDLHDALLRTVELCLSEPNNGRASSDLITPCVLVFYTHHRPQFAERDLQFFTKAKECNWVCEEIVTEKFEPMFPEDSGDPEVRATVHGWRLTRATRPNSP